MKKTKKMNYQNELLGLVVMCVGALLISSLLGMLISKEIVPEVTGPIATVALTELLVVVTCYVTVRKRGQQRFLTAVVLAAAFCVIRLLAGLMANFDGEIQLLPCLITVSAGAVGGIWGNAKKKRRR